ncbi:hypothetical protein ANCDUO_14833 [Ancylostoma duodenale]|uniref:Uncharacterized protein n=1 Tax=Ancylostoma duodenale TaxID=51022 RepID=A0A0C2CFB3_9BILA|nr:hypothetical protein ANCDUO_14833 [Ancylostoma duodenale]
MDLNSRAYFTATGFQMNLDNLNKFDVYIYYLTSRGIVPPNFQLITSTSFLNAVHYTNFRSCPHYRFKVYLNDSYLEANGPVTGICKKSAQATKP